MRSVFRPVEKQRQLYNGHKRVHVIKFQSVVCPDGMIANLCGPIEGRRHDSFMLSRFGILHLMGIYSVYVGIHPAL